MRTSVYLLFLTLVSTSAPSIAGEGDTASPAANATAPNEHQGDGGDLFLGEYTIAEQVISASDRERIRHREAIALGMLQHRRGDLAGAFKTFEKAAETQEDSIVSLVAMAEICFQDNAHRAQVLLDEASETAQEYYRYHLIQSFVHKKRGKMEKALNSLNRCLDLKPNHTDARRERATFLQAKTDSPESLRQAIEDYQILQQALPQQSPLWNYFIGMCYFHLKEYERAQKIFEPLTGLSGGGEAAYWMGRCKAELGDYEGAMEYLSRSHRDPRAREYMAKIALDRANSSTGEERLKHLNHYLEGMSQLLQLRNYSRQPRNFLEAGRAAFEVRRINDTVVYLRKYLSLVPNDEEAKPLLLHALILTRDASKEPEIASLYKEFVSTHSATQTLPIRFEYVDYLLALHQWEKAQKELAFLRETMPADGRPVFLQARVSFQAERYAESIEAARRALGLLPDIEAEIQILIGQAYLKSGSSDAAAKAFEKSILASPDEYKALRYFEIGEIYRSGEWEREGIAYWEKALELSPSNHSLRYAVAKAYLHSGSFELSAGHFSRVAEGTEEKGTRAGAETLLAYIRAIQGASEEAERRYRKAIEISPHNPIAYTGLAHLLADQERYEEARESFKLAVSQDPNDATLLIQYGITCDKLDDIECAEQVAEQAIEVDPEYAEAYNFIGYLYAERGIKLDRALEYIEKAMELRPDDPNITDSLGWVYYQMGENEKALKYLETAVSLLGEEDQYGSSVIFEHLGDAYHKAGKIEESREMWGKAAEGLPNSDTAREKLSSLASEPKTE